MPTEGAAPDDPVNVKVVPLIAPFVKVVSDEIGDPGKATAVGNEKFVNPETGVTVISEDE